MGERACFPPLPGGIAKLNLDKPQRRGAEMQMGRLSRPIWDSLPN